VGPVSRPPRNITAGGHFSFIPIGMARSPAARGLRLLLEDAAVVVPPLRHRHQDHPAPYLELATRGPPQATSIRIPGKQLAASRSRAADQLAEIRSRTDMDQPTGSPDQAPLRAPAEPERVALPTP